MLFGQKRSDESHFSSSVSMCENEKHIYRVCTQPHDRALVCMHNDDNMTNSSIEPNLHTS